MHLAGKAHKKMVEKGAVGGEGANAPPAARAPPKFRFSLDSLNLNLQKHTPVALSSRCEVCDIETTDQLGLNAHQAGKKHAKMLRKRQQEQQQQAQGQGGTQWMPGGVLNG